MGISYTYFLDIVEFNNFDSTSGEYDDTYLYTVRMNEVILGTFPMVFFKYISFSYIGTRPTQSPSSRTLNLHSGINSLSRLSESLVVSSPSPLSWMEWCTLPFIFFLKNIGSINSGDYTTLVNLFLYHLPIIILSSEISLLYAKLRMPDRPKGELDSANRYNNFIWITKKYIIDRSKNVMEINEINRAQFTGVLALR